MTRDQLLSAELKGRFEEATRALNLLEHSQGCYAGQPCASYCKNARQCSRIRGIAKRLNAVRARITANGGKAA